MLPRLYDISSLPLPSQGSPWLCYLEIGFPLPGSSRLIFLQLPFRRPWKRQLSSAEILISYGDRLPHSPWPPKVYRLNYPSPL